MTLSLLLLGFLIGMRHATEADHLAAVATLVTRSRSVGQALRHGAVWGLGHTLTLFIFGSIVLVLDTVMSERLAHGLEFMVGVMLVGLGADVLRRVTRERIHFHTHKHSGGTAHFHAHSHRGERDHDPERHDHMHRRGFPFHALFVGLMHGMAGSAALILLTLQTMDSLWRGLLYIALFGVGSIAGMAVLSVIVAVPLRYSARSLTWLHNSLQGGIGLVTIILGVMLIYETSLLTD